jgi:hypothetical protein
MGPGEAGEQCGEVEGVDGLVAIEVEKLAAGSAHSAACVRPAGEVRGMGAEAFRIRWQIAETLQLVSIHTP